MIAGCNGYHTMRRRIMGAMLAGTTLLAGCGTTVTKQTFDLGAVSAASAINNMRTAQQKHIQILIANPDALKALDGQDIVVRGPYSAISYLKDAQWGDRLPNIVQARLARAFEDSGRFGGIGRPGDGLAINYQIITDIRLFGIDLQENSKIAHVEIAAKIMDDKTGNVHQTRIFSAQNPVLGMRNGDYAKALDEAFSVVVKDIVNWTLKGI